MLSQRLIRGFIVELTMYALLFWYAVFRMDAAPLKVFLIIFGIALGLRALIVLGMFVISELWKCIRPDDMKIGLFGAVRLYLAELYSFLCLYALYHPFAKFFAQYEGPHSVWNSSEPVLLVHGFSCNAAYWRPMQKALDKAGIQNTWTISLEPLSGDIDRLADQLAGRVKEICAKCDAERVTLVGHSMGGLVSRAYARKVESSGRISRIITLGSPHHGTIHSHFSGARNARQMRINNEWLNELNREEGQPPAVPVFSLYSFHDNIVSPQDSPELEHAENFGFAGIGHLEMSFSYKVQEKVVDILQKSMHHP